MLGKFAPLSVAAIVLLNSCGGGGTEPDNNPPDPDNNPPPTLQETVISGFEITPTSITAIEGETRETAGTITIDDMNGTFDYVGGTGLLNDGGSISFLATEADAVVYFRAEPASGPTRQGIVGIVTPSGDLPLSNPSATYSGMASLIIVENEYLWQLTGNSTVQADFSGASALVVIDGLSGIVFDAAAISADVSDVGSLSFSNVSINNGSLSGGIASLNSSQISSILSGNETVDLKGALFGEKAAALGALFIVEDEANLSVQGGLIAAR